MGWLRLLVAPPDTQSTLGKPYARWRTPLSVASAHIAGINTHSSHTSGQLEQVRCRQHANEAGWLLNDFAPSDVPFWCGCIVLSWRRPFQDCVLAQKQNVSAMQIGVSRDNFMEHAWRPCAKAGRRPSLQYFITFLREKGRRRDTGRGKLGPGIGRCRTTIHHLFLSSVVAKIVQCVPGQGSHS